MSSTGPPDPIRGGLGSLFTLCGNWIELFKSKVWLATITVIVEGRTVCW